MKVRTEVFFDSGEEMYLKALNRAKENMTGMTLDPHGVIVLLRIVAELKKEIENGGSRQLCSMR